MQPGHLHVYQVRGGGCGMLRLLGPLGRNAGVRGSGVLGAEAAARSCQRAAASRQEPPGEPPLPAARIRGDNKQRAPPLRGWRGVHKSQLPLFLFLVVCHDADVRTSGRLGLAKLNLGEQWGGRCALSQLPVQPGPTWRGYRLREGRRAQGS